LNLFTERKALTEGLSNEKTENKKQGPIGPVNRTCSRGGERKSIQGVKRQKWPVKVGRNFNGGKKSKWGNTGWAQ